MSNTQIKHVVYANRTTSPDVKPRGKAYHQPKLKRLGDFHTMTRTGMVMMGAMDLVTNGFWIS